MSHCDDRSASRSRPGGQEPIQALLSTRLQVRGILIFASLALAIGAVLLFDEPKLMLIDSNSGDEPGSNLTRLFAVFCFVSLTLKAAQLTYGLVRGRPRVQVRDDGVEFIGLRGRPSAFTWAEIEAIEPLRLVVPPDSVWVRAMPEGWRERNAARQGTEFTVHPRGARPVRCRQVVDGSNARLHAEMTTRWRRAVANRA